MSFNFMLLFIMTVFIASIIPGPSMLLALTHGMNYGAKRTLASALGNVTVTLIQASVSIVGLGTVLLASESFFLVIKWAGAAYLIYMGITILCSAKMSFSPGKSDHCAKWISLKKMFLQSAFVTAGNPKAVVFFTAVFPQFINPEAAFVSQASILLGTCALNTFGCFMLYAVGGQKIALLFSTAKVGHYVKRVVGGTFVGAGIGLAMSHK